MATQGQPLTYGQEFEVLKSLDGSKSKATKHSKKQKKVKGTQMPNETNEVTEVTDQEQNAAPESTEGVKRIQKTVFDLGTFSNVTLYKDVTLPKKPESIQEAQAAVGGSTEKLMKLIYEGLKAETLAAESLTMEGFCISDADYPLDQKNPLGAPYTGVSADQKKKDLINSAVLSMAKMLGYSSENTAEKNAELKAQAMKIIRDNPVMMKSLQS